MKTAMKTRSIRYDPPKIIRPRYEYRTDPRDWVEPQDPGRVRLGTILLAKEETTGLSKIGL